MIERHHGMDWLRIGAFAVLIPYHIAMAFVPWDFHVNSAHGAAWVRLPMLAANAWRLTLLFVVSGYATRALLARSTGVGGFLMGRTHRLLLPLAFGVAVIVPPQVWAELTVKHGYPDDYLSFWLHDYFRFRPLAGLAMPSWNHLWFVGYLWVYTVGLALAAALLGGRGAQSLFDRVFGGWAVLALPLAWLACVHGWWFPMRAETHRFFADPIAHLTFLPAFLFGFGLAGSPAAMRAIARWAPVAALVALAGYAIVAGLELGPARTRRTLHQLYGVGHALEQWGAIVALVGMAERWGRHDNRWRATLTEAVFPFYIIHQTIIVVAMAALLPADLPGLAEFAILLAATVAGCWLFYLAGREIGWLRPLIGLRARRPRPTRALDRPAIA